MPDWLIELGKAGGFTLFSVAVWWELRQLRPVNIAIGSVMVDIKTFMARSLERDRARDERAAAHEAAVGNGMAPEPSELPSCEDEPTEPIELVPPKPHAQTNPFGHPLAFKRKP